MYMLPQLENKTKQNKTKQKNEEVFQEIVMPTNIRKKVAVILLCHVTNILCYNLMELKETSITFPLMPEKSTRLFIFFLKEISQIN